MLLHMVGEPGRILQRRLHGTTATYRVLHDDADGGVLVEVVDAPGLPAGFQMRLTADVARAMELAAEPQPAPASLKPAIAPASNA